jgi:integrase/recombinase XerD
LGFLKRNAMLEADQLPAERATPEYVQAYVRQLQREVAPRTVVSTLVGLKVMLKAMAPEANWSWLVDICNALNRRSRPGTAKYRRMRPTEEIYAAAANELERLARTPLWRRIDRVAFRDTLMVALMALRPLRLTNFSSLKISEDFVLERDTWTIQIPGENVKNGQPLEFTFPDALLPHLDLYLKKVRPSFSRSLGFRQLWLHYRGTPLDVHSVYCRVVLVTKRLLGVAINPHLFRHCAATSLATQSPAAALASGALLGHRSITTTQRYYIRASALDASRTVNAVLQKPSRARE